MKLNTFSCSTPESEFDNWYESTHPNGTASWEEDEDIPEHEVMEDEDE
jgi:hypothetical protein